MAQRYSAWVTPYFLPLFVQLKRQFRAQTSCRLQVDYREQYAAAGRFPGGFTKREGKANDDEILTSRLVDRVLRPLFPSDYHCEVYVQVMLLSADGVDQLMHLLDWQLQQLLLLQTSLSSILHQRFALHELTASTLLTQPSSR